MAEEEQELTQPEEEQPEEKAVDLDARIAAAVSAGIQGFAETEFRAALQALNQNYERINQTLTAKLESIPTLEAIVNQVVATIQQAQPKTNGNGNGNGHHQSMEDMAQQLGPAIQQMQPQIPPAPQSPTAELAQKASSLMPLVESVATIGMNFYEQIQKMKNPFEQLRTIAQADPVMFRYMATLVQPPDPMLPQIPTMMAHVGTGGFDSGWKAAFQAMAAAKASDPGGGAVPYNPFAPPPNPSSGEYDEPTNSSNGPYQPSDVEFSNNQPGSGNSRNGTPSRSRSEKPRQRTESYEEIKPVQMIRRWG